MSNLSRAFRTLALIGVVNVAAATTIARAQAEPPQPDRAAVQQHQVKMKQMKAQMKMPSMDELAAMKKANSDRIAALMAKVKGAQGDDRMAALAEVIGILVEERAAMQQHCAEMCAMMAK
jgi:hypothetical protein